MLNRADAIRLENERQERKRKNLLASTSNSILAAIDMITIFMMMLRDDWRAFSHHIANYFTFSLAALFEVLGAIFSIRHVFFDKSKTTGRAKWKNVADAVLQTAAAIATVVAVAGGFAFAAVFAVASPVIFAAIAGVRTVYNLVMGGIFAIKAWRQNDSVKKDHYKSQAKMRLTHAVVAGLFTAAILTVMVFGMVTLAPLAVAASIIAIGAHVYGAAKRTSDRKQTAADQESVNGGSYEKLYNRMGFEKEPLLGQTKTQGKEVGKPRPKSEILAPRYRSQEEDTFETAQPAFGKV